MSKEINTPKLSIAVLFIIFAIIAFSIFVRAQGLGYSGFQGDEVNPMTFLYGMKDGPLAYLIEQKRAPMQYIINLINVGLFGYHNEEQIRVPFLIFGVLALVTIYNLAKKIFDKNVAIFAALFMAVNGLFIAFSRITQYQSFMFFLIPIAVLLFIKAHEKHSLKLYFYSGLLMSIALLAHLDTLSVFPFFIVVFLSDLLRGFSVKSFKENFPLVFRSGLSFFIAFLIPAAIYYIPYFMHPAFSDGTSSYLEGRLLGGGLMPRTQITLKLLKMYIPKFHLYSLFILGVIGLAFKAKDLDLIKLGKLSISKKIVQNLYLFGVFVFAFASEFSMYPIKPRLSTLMVLATSIFISGVLLISKKVDYKFAALATWFLGTYSFYFYIMRDPRTHVYVSILPLFILASYGFWKFYTVLKSNLLRSVSVITLLLSILYVCGVNWVVFVDKSPEYPWWDKDFLGNPIYRIKRVRHEKIEGVFGFNQYRAWDQVADLYKRGCLVGSYNSNEKDAITYFYLREHQAQGGLWELQTTNVDNLIVVPGPHSWVYTGLSGTDLGGFYLLKTIYSEYYPDEPISYIYGLKTLYPEGKLLCE